MFERIKEELIKEKNAHLERELNALKEYKSVEEAQKMRWDLRKLKTIKGMEKSITNKWNKYYFEEADLIKAIEEAKEFSTPLIVSVEWKKSRMWGNNPRSSTNFGFTGEIIGGCGYDKQSTALAEALNSHLPLLKLLCLAEERALKEGRNKDERRQYLGYGSGYRIIPKFEGGVGIESHRSIIRGLNLEFEHISGKTFDVFTIKAGEKNEQNKL